jgi:hypothetical protein
MKIHGKIDMSSFNSSGDGYLLYSTELGTIELEYCNFLEYLNFPTPDEWKVRYKGSWALSLRDEIMKDLIHLILNKDRPDYEVSKTHIRFFNAKALLKESKQATGLAAQTQSPPLAIFIESFRKAESENPKTTLFVFNVSEVSGNKATVSVSEIISGTSAMANGHLNIGFDPRVQILAGCRYLTFEAEAIILQYVNTRHTWRCCLHVEVDNKTLILVNESLS